MAEIQFENGDFDVDAQVIARGFGLECGDVPAMMRTGEISGRVERGEGEDAGRFRLTFVHREQRLRLIVDESGAILHGAIDDD